MKLGNNFTRVFSKSKGSGFGQNASEIMFLFHKSSIWLPVNIMGDELSLQSWIFEMFILDRTIEDKNSLKS